jgi:LacI family gluconate utilization system Gnt-I transcriptional repressor
MHLHVPNKIGICGFNDIEMAAYAEPALSSVNVNRYEMGSRSMELILERLNNLANTSPNQSNYIDTGFELFMRKTTR